MKRHCTKCRAVMGGPGGIGAGLRSAHCGVALLLAGLLLPVTGIADEQVFGYVKGAETLPKNAWEAYQWLTWREGKGSGHYDAVDSETEIEYGLTDRLSASTSFKMQSIDTEGIIVDAYIPGDEEYGFKASGVEAAVKYNFLKTALDPIGFSTYLALDYGWLDPHSGQEKNTISLELEFLLQKYFLDGRMIWVGDLGIESTRADRGEIGGTPPDYEWPTDPEMEIENTLGTGLSYRFVPNWFLGVESQYQSEQETVVGQERWSVFAGPTLHYGGERWWGSFSWFPQIVGGGESYPEQNDTDLHLIEKTEQEFRLKAGLNF